MKLTNKLDYPEAFVKAAESYVYPRKADRIGVTDLIESPYIRQLFIKEYDNITLDVDDFFGAMLGSAWHTLLQNNICIGQIAEKKYEYKIGDLTLVGKADVVSETTIEDYKLMAAFSWVFDKDKHFVEQLNILNWLRFKTGGEHSKDLSKFLRLHCFIKDWTAYQAERDKDYPQQRYFSRDLPIWPLERTEKFINDRLKLHLDPNYKCSEEDKWVRLEKFAVMKEGRKTALRLLDTYAEAEKWKADAEGLQPKGSSGLSIVQRKSQPRRCEGYCSVRSVCSYALSLNK